jgi:hypothetical protein
MRNSSLKSVGLIFMLFFLVFTSGFSSDTIQNSETGRGFQKQHDKYFLRGGIGSQGILSLIYPSDINVYTNDLYGFIKKSFSAFNSGNEPKEIHWGYGYSVKLDLRALNLFQLAFYWDRFYSFPLEVLFDEMITMYSLKATYKFQVAYDEKGISLLFVPGSKTKNIFLTVGGGVGLLKGQFTQTVSGYKRVKGKNTDLDATQTYKGSTYAYHGTVGLTFVPWHYLELELVLNGRYALIRSLTDDSGAVFTNPYMGNETITLNLSGADLRVGFKFIFP